MESILIGYPLDKYSEFASLLDWLGKKYVLECRDYDYNWLSANIERFEHFVPSIKVKIDDDIINKAMKLKTVFSPATGNDHLGFTRSERIKVVTLADFKEEIWNISSTAELAFCFILSLSRKVVLACGDVLTKGVWDRNKFLGDELKGKVVGIVGMGRVGRKISSYAEAFGLKINYWDKKSVDGRWQRIEKLEKLLSNCDYIVCSVSLTEETQYLLDKSCLKYFKDGSYFINISRGKVVEESMLVEGIERDIFNGVATDVLESELEDVGASILYNYARRNPGKNIIITPHIGGATLQAWKAVFGLILKAIN